MREWEIGKIIKVAGELYEVCENDNPKGFSLCSDCDLARGGCGQLWYFQEWFKQQEGYVYGEKNRRDI